MSKSTLTGTVAARTKPRQPSANNPMRFRYVASIAVEPAQATPEAQQERDAKWVEFTAWALSIANQEPTCA